MLSRVVYATLGQIKPKENECQGQPRCGKVQSLPRAHT